MHIVDVADFYAPLGGSVKTYIDAKLAFARQNGARISVIAPGPEHRVEKRDGGQIIYVPAPAIPAPAIPAEKRHHFFWKSAPIHRLLDTLHPDVVEASSPLRAAGIVAGWRGPMAARAHKSLVIHTDAVAAHPQVWFRNLLSAKMVDHLCVGFWAYLRRTSRACSSVVVGSRWFSERLQQHGRIPSTVIPFGVDTALFHPEKRNREYRRRLLAGFGLSPSATLLIGVGRHHRAKQWPKLFEAVGALSSRNVAMVQIGDGRDNERMRQAAARAGNVRLLGHMADRALLAETMASADALIHGSRSDSFGLVAAESLASGLPLILPAEGGCTEMADPAWSELYLPGSSGTVCQAIERLLARDRQTLRNAASGARKTHLSTAATHFEQLFALYGSKRPASTETAAELPPSGHPLPMIAEAFRI